MKQKLNRYGKKRKRSALTTCINILLCIAMVTSGFFVAKFANEHQRNQPSNVDITSNATTSSAVSNDNKQPPSNDTDVVVPPDDKPSTPASLSHVRAFYLPHSALQSDTLTSTLTAAYRSGFNAVIFDLKDADGHLYYRFADEQAEKVGYTADALTADDLSSLFDRIRECGLHPIPRLYAFRDDLACTKLTDARICHVDNHSWAWYDGDKTKGAKKWLNPYSGTAQSYIQGLAKELKAKGASAVMLEGVQFPDKLASSAYLGDAAATISKDQVLTDFIKAVRTALGTDCPLLLGCTSAGALGTDTKIYGGNPLTFGAAITSPLLSSNTQEAIEKMALRIQVLESKPLLAPMLATKDLSTQQVKEAIAACTANDAGFILYHPAGQYDFATYDLP